MQISDWINSGVALGTGGLAYFTYRSVDEAGKARGHWASMAKDATRARLDAAAPPVNVEAINVPSGVYGHSEGGHFENSWPVERPWTIPKDQEIGLALKLKVQVSNKSSSFVRISFHGPFYTLGRIGYQSHNLLPEAELIVEFNAIFTVREWLENYDAGQRGDDLPHWAQGKIVMSDRNENGVDDAWHVKLTGVPIERMESDAGKARQTGSGGPMMPQPYREYYEVGYRRRTYYTSRENNVTIGNS